MFEVLGMLCYDQLGELLPAGSLDNTLLTLRFANDARKIRMLPKQNQIVNFRSLLKDKELEIERLKALLVGLSTTPWAVLASI